MQPWSFLIILLAPIFTLASHPHPHLQQQPIMSSSSLNVLKSPLKLFSTSPMTGFLRNGYCEAPAADYGNHSVAAEVTDEFLEFSARQGNDLRVIPGMKGGCRWCLCASRWREAFDARGKEGDKVVPKIFLSATHEKALSKMSLDELKGFAAKED